MSWGYLVFAALVIGGAFFLGLYIRDVRRARTRSWGEFEVEGEGEDTAGEEEAGEGGE